MKRNKYYPSHYINGVRKRNCIKKKIMRDRTIRECSLTEILEDLEYIGDKNLVQNYLRGYYEAQTYSRNF